MLSLFCPSTKETPPNGVVGLPFPRSKQMNGCRFIGSKSSPFSNATASTMHMQRLFCSILKRHTVVSIMPSASRKFVFRYHLKRPWGYPLSVICDYDWSIYFPRDHAKLEDGCHLLRLKVGHPCGSVNIICFSLLFDGMAEKRIESCERNWFWLDWYETTRTWNSPLKGFRLCLGCSWKPTFVLFNLTHWRSSYNLQLFLILS